MTLDCVSCRMRTRGGGGGHTQSLHNSVARCWAYKIEGALCGCMTDSDGQTHTHTHMQEEEQLSTLNCSSQPGIA